MFYKRVGIIPQEILANNVIPESFGSDAGERFDLLLGKAMSDIALKLESYILDYGDEGCKCLIAYECDVVGLDPNTREKLNKTTTIVPFYKNALLPN